MKPPKVLLILFDGAEWDLINPLIAGGRLPNLAAFMREASYGRLRSLDGVALASPLLWTSIATGKLPHKHGVRDFYATSYSVNTSRLWEIFEHDGLPIGLFRYLITWPPRPTKGFIVPDWCARTHEAFPAELSFINAMPRINGLLPLARSALQAMRQGMRATTLLLSLKEHLRERITRPPALDVWYRKRFVELAIHADIFTSLVRRHSPYLAVFYHGLPDAVQHKYWKFMEPGKFEGVTDDEERRYRKVIPEAYERIDRRLEQLLGCAGPDTLVVMASDHGGEANVEEEYRWADIRGEELIKALGLSGAVNTLRIGPRTYFRFSKRGAEGTGSARSLADLLGKVIIEGSHTPIFLVEVSGDDELHAAVIYLKERMEGATLLFPDGRRFPASRLLNMTPTISGNHSMHGVVLMKGPNVRKGMEIKGASLLDVTPTILALLGRPVGRDMDGKVLTDAVEDEFLRSNPVRLIDSYDTLLGKAVPGPVETNEGMDEVKERLRALGYID